MSVAFVRSNNVLEKDGITYMWGSSYPSGQSLNIPVENTAPIGVFWKVPVVKFTNSIEVGYTIEAVNPTSPSTPPTADAVKMLRLKNDVSGDEWGIAIANDDEESTSSPSSQWAFLSNGTGGTLPVMPSVTIPVPSIQTGPITSVTSGATTTNTFQFIFPANPQADKYTIPAAWFNDTLGAAFVPGTITTLAALVTWANTSGNWDGYGTWSAVNATTLKLVSTTSSSVFVTKAGLPGVALTPSVHALDMSAGAFPASVDGVSFGGGAVPIPFKSGAMTAANTTASKQALINAITNIYQPNQVTAAISGSNINFTTTLGVCKVFIGNTVVATST